MLSGCQRNGVVRKDNGYKELNRGYVSVSA